MGHSSPFVVKERDQILILFRGPNSTISRFVGRELEDSRSLIDYGVQGGEVFNATSKFVGTFRNLLNDLSSNL